SSGVSGSSCQPTTSSSCAPSTGESRRRTALPSPSEATRWPLFCTASGQNGHTPIWSWSRDRLPCGTRSRQDSWPLATTPAAAHCCWQRWGRMRDVSIFGIGPGYGSGRMVTILSRSRPASPSSCSRSGSCPRPDQTLHLTAAASRLPGVQALRGAAAGELQRSAVEVATPEMRAEISYDLVMDDDMAFVEGTYRLAGGAWQVVIVSAFERDVPAPQVVPQRWESGVSGV